MSHEQLKELSTQLIDEILGSFEPAQEAFNLATKQFTIAGQEALVKIAEQLAPRSQPRYNFLISSSWPIPHERTLSSFHQIGFVLLHDSGTEQSVLKNHKLGTDNALAFYVTQNTPGHMKTFVLLALIASSLGLIFSRQEGLDSYYSVTSIDYPQPGAEHA